MKTLYMDHSATTPTDQAVVEAMLPYFTEIYGNASSIHSVGQEAKRALEQAREHVAKLIGASPTEIIFTSGGTEADNQAIIGFLEKNTLKGKHLITSAIEHHAVLDTCKYLEKKGYELTILPVNNEGYVELATLKAALKSDTVLVSIMHANNEISTIQNIKQLAEIAHANGSFFHTDAVQTVGKIPIDVQKLGVDMLSLSAHKFYGPKGIGALYVKRGLRIGSFLHGGAQERNRRASTENIPAIVGLGKAAELALHDQEKEATRLLSLTEELISGILANVPQSRLTGEQTPANRLPGLVSFCFDYVEGESILLMLDSFGIKGSSGSACTSGSLEPSHVLLAIGIPIEVAHGSLRLSLGHSTTGDDVVNVVTVLPGILKTLRSMSPLTPKNNCCCADGPCCTR